MKEEKRTQQHRQNAEIDNLQSGGEKADSQETRSMDALQQQFHEMVEAIKFVSIDDIPRIDLYMDQVLTFMEEHLKSGTRDPEHDKILTKTMINNYVKNDVLIPPVRKKYGMDHMVLLLVIYYLKSFLSIGDIQKVVEPLKDQDESLEQIYRTTYENLKEEIESSLQETDRQFERAKETFPDNEELQKFALIARMSTEIYLKKLYIERLLDQDTDTKSRK